MLRVIRELFSPHTEAKASQKQAKVAAERVDDLQALQQRLKTNQEEFDLFKDLAISRDSEDFLQEVLEKKKQSAEQQIHLLVQEFAETKEKVEKHGQAACRFYAQSKTLAYYKRKVVAVEQAVSQHRGFFIMCTGGKLKKSNLDLRSELETVVEQLNFIIPDLRQRQVPHLQKAYKTQRRLEQAFASQAEPLAEAKDDPQPVNPQVQSYSWAFEKRIEELKNTHLSLFCLMLINVIMNRAYWHEQLLFASLRNTQSMPTGIEKMQQRIVANYSETPKWLESPEHCVNFLRAIQGMAEERLDLQRGFGFFGPVRSLHTTQFYSFLSKLRVEKLCSRETTADAEKVDAIQRINPKVIAPYPLYPKKTTILKKPDAEDSQSQVVKHVRFTVPDNSTGRGTPKFC